MTLNQIRGSQIRSGTITNTQVADNAEIALSKIAGGVDLSNRLTDAEANLAFPVAHIFENNSQVYADGRPPVQDPSALLRDGWYFKNTSAGHKINWYFYDGTVTNVTVANFSAYAVVTLDSLTSRPFLVIGTVPTGVGDASPGFYNSARTFLIPNGAAVVETKYLIYVGQNPKVHTDLPRIELTVGPTYGTFTSGQRVAFSAIHTDSGASVNTVQVLVERLGVNATTFKQEYELRIRKATQVELNLVDTRLDLLEDDAVVNREVPSGAINGSNVTFTLANTPVAGSEQVFLNGLLQDPGPGNSYTISGAVITFASAPLSGDEIHVSYATGDYMVSPGNPGTYVPADPTDWASPAPTTLSDAVDRLANALRAQSGSPVP